MYLAAVSLLQIIIPADTVIRKVPPGIGVGMDISPITNNTIPVIKVTNRMLLPLCVT